MAGTPPLLPFWLESTPEQVAAAPDLIVTYMRSAMRYVQLASQLYPHEDVEPRVMYGLYKAAYTYKPGKAGFINWLRTKVRGEMSMIRQKHRRQVYNGVHLESLNTFRVDDRFYYGA